MTDRKDQNYPDDDSYIIEDTGESVADIEHEMEIAAQEADDTMTRRPAAAPEGPPASSEDVKKINDRYLRTLADFENYRKRMERERSETYNRVVAEIAAKLLPVLDNLKRALETEASVEASESDEFRHFLSGVDLIYKQLNGVLDALGVKPILAEGEHFDPHLHEAVVTESTDDHEPDTVIQEIVRGFRLGDKLIRPALVKVAVKK